MATITVTTLNDSGAGSLRQALATAEAQAGADTVVFAAGLTGKTIALTSGPLTILTGSVTIDGDRNNDGVRDIVLSGSNASSILLVAAGASVVADGIEFTGGYERANPGLDAVSAIRNMGILTVKNSMVIANWATGGNGVGYIGMDGGDAATVINYGTLTVTGTRFEGNVARGGAGGYATEGTGASIDGGRGGSGGDAAAGILNETSRTLIVSGVSFLNSTANGGKGADGGNGYIAQGAGYGGNGGNGGAGGDISFGILARPSTVTGTATQSGGGGSDGNGGRRGGGDILNNASAGADGHTGALMLVRGEGATAIATSGFNGPQSIYAGDAGQVITGGAGADHLTGGYGYDTITGADGDYMNGGLGADTIIVTHVSRSTFATGGGFTYADTLDLSQAQALTGILDLGAAFLTTSAGGRFTTFRNIVGSSGGETIIGNAFSQSLNGGGGNDTLYTGGGSDTLTGGPGDDTFVDPVGSTVVEAANGGNDTIIASSGNLDLNSFASGNVENVTLTGGGDTDAAGTEANNRLTGNAGSNSLLGAGGNDTLAGLGGPDTLAGGPGNDIYVNPDSGDAIVEAAGAAGGTHDRIQTLSSFNLATVSNVEDITLVGANNVNAIGDNFANILIGNAGNNILNGGGGADTLTGGAGNDTMNGGAAADLFKFATSGAGADTIAGFEKTLDHFNLGGGTFSARTEAGGSTTLTHNGGTILVTGVIGLTLTQWKALIVTTGREASDSAADATGTAHASHHADLAPTHWGHADFLFA